MAAVLIVDGQSEYRAMPLIVDRIRDSGCDIVKTLFVPLQPLAPTAYVAQQCFGRIKLLGCDVNRAIVILDRESRGACAVDIAQELVRSLAGRCNIAVAVVIKDRTFENWLVADVDALRRRLPRRFRLSAGDVRAIVASGADLVDAPTIIRRSAVGHAYDKVPDSQRILRAAEPLRMAATSRSFRRFLRVAGHRAYATQSRVAVAV